jgi:hypothetical protein
MPNKLSALTILPNAPPNLSPKPYKASPVLSAKFSKLI